MKARPRRLPPGARGGRGGADTFAGILLVCESWDRFTARDLFVLLGFLQQASFDPPSCRGFRQRAKMGRLALMVVGNISGERPREHFWACRKVFPRTIWKEVALC